MGEDAARINLIQAINRAFSSEEIGATLQKLQPIRPRDDFLSICERLGFLRPIHEGDYERYRRELSIPPLGKRVITISFRTALLHRPQPVPLHIDIRSGDEEAVEIIPTPKLIRIVLTRK